jgi:hypothetical protein
LLTGVANKDVTALFHVYDDSANADQDGATPNKQGKTTLLFFFCRKTLVKGIYK